MHDFHEIVMTSPGGRVDGSSDDHPPASDLESPLQPTWIPNVDLFCVLSGLLRSHRMPKPDYCENRLLAICSPDAPVQTGTCPGMVESGTVLKGQARSIHTYGRLIHSVFFWNHKNALNDLGGSLCVLTTYRRPPDTGACFLSYLREKLRGSLAWFPLTPPSGGQ